ncbi:MAG TPA: DoxX family protein [Actinomycetota bacterium]
MDIGLLLLRLVLGGTFVAHGTQKLFGWLGGHGLDDTGRFYEEQLGYPRGRLAAALAGLAETGGGLLLAFGLLTPLGAAATVGVMLNATLTVHLRNGFFNQDGGFEYPLVNAAAAAALAFVGPGSISLDAALGLGLSGLAWGFVALLLGLIVGTAVYWSREMEWEEPGEEEDRRAA